MKIAFTIISALLSLIRLATQYIIDKSIITNLKTEEDSQLDTNDFSLESSDVNRTILVHTQFWNILNPKQSSQVSRDSPISMYALQLVLKTTISCHQSYVNLVTIFIYTISIISSYCFLKKKPAVIPNSHDLSRWMAAIILWYFTISAHRVTITTTTAALELNWRPPKSSTLIISTISVMLFVSLNNIMVYDLECVSKSYGDAINEYFIQPCIWMVKCKQKPNIDWSVCKAASPPYLNISFDYFLTESVRGHVMVSW